MKYRDLLDLLKRYPIGLDSNVFICADQEEPTHQVLAATVRVSRAGHTEILLRLAPLVRPSLRPEKPS